MKKETYDVRAVIVAVVGSTKGGFNVVFERIDEITDESNPFVGQKKLAVKRFEKYNLVALAKIWKVYRISKLVHKNVILRMKDDNSLFECVMAIARDDKFGFRAVSQKLPKFVIEESNGIEELGVMYK